MSKHDYYHEFEPKTESVKYKGKALLVEYDYWHAEPENNIHEELTIEAIKYEGVDVTDIMSDLHEAIESLILEKWGMMADV